MEGKMGGTIGTDRGRLAGASEGVGGRDSGAERSLKRAWRVVPRCFPRPRSGQPASLPATKTDSVGQISRSLLQGFILPPISG